jgi:predicted nucleic acid-binding protein
VFVLDASVALVFLLGQDGVEAAEDAVGLMGEEPACAPAHWSLEIANVLARELRRGSLAPEEASALAMQAEAWEVMLDPQTGAQALSRTLTLAAEHRLTAYDAAYLELCLRRQAPLASFDAQLVRAARAVGVELVLDPGAALG